MKDDKREIRDGKFAITLKKGEVPAAVYKGNGKEFSWTHRVLGEIKLAQGVTTPISEAWAQYFLPRQEKLKIQLTAIKE